MSGGRLCTLLGELGYEGWEALDPDSFEWPFQYEDTRPLLNWICSNLRTSNVLSLSELSQLPLSLSLPITHYLFHYGLLIIIECEWFLSLFQVRAVQARREVVRGDKLHCIEFLVLELEMN